MHSHDAFGELRQLVHRPRLEAFVHLCDRVDAYPDAVDLEGQVLPYLERHLASWPDAMRRPRDNAWLTTADEPAPAHWPLVRHLHLERRYVFDHPGLCARLRTQLAQATLPWVTLHHCDLHERNFGAALSTLKLEETVGLDLGKNALGPPGATMLAEAPFRALDELYLDAAALEPEGFKALIGAPWMRALGELVIERDRISDERGSAGRLLARAPLEALRHLTLNGALVSGSDLTQLALAPWFRDLHSLCLDEHDFGTTCGLRPLVDTANVDELRYLGLSQNALRDEHIHDLIAQRWPALRELGLAYNIDCAWGIVELARSGHMPQLRELKLGGCHLRNDQLVALAADSELHQLEVLYLWHSSFDALALRALLESPNHPHLRALGLGYTRLLGRAFEGPCPALAGLEQLYLNHCALSDDDILRLVEAPLERLEVLHLDGNVIGPRGIEALAGAASLASLEELVLDRSSLDEDSKRAIAESPYLRRSIKLRYV